MIQIKSNGLDLHKQEPNDILQQLPVTILDLKRTAAVLDISLPMADPCPNCGAFRMNVGDYVYLGQCGICEEEVYKAYQLRKKKWLQGNSQ